jgi:DNA topoisomerase-1
LKSAEEVGKSQFNTMKCDLCGGDMIIRVSRNGRFLGCSNYPDCSNTKPISAAGKNGKEKTEPVIAEGEFCDKCQSPMFVRAGKFGKFLGCSKYPECDGIRPITSKIACPKCKEGMVVEKFSAKTKKKF